MLIPAISEAIIRHNSNASSYVIEKARELVENGDGNNAIAILETITATYAQEWDELMDYGGDSYSIAEPLDSAWTEAILSAKTIASGYHWLAMETAELLSRLSLESSLCILISVADWREPKKYQPRLYPKLQLFAEVLGDLLENRHKALVFSQFVALDKRKLTRLTNLISLNKPSLEYL